MGATSVLQARQRTLKLKCMLWLFLLSFLFPLSSFSIFTTSYSPLFNTLHLHYDLRQISETKTGTRSLADKVLLEVIWCINTPLVTSDCTFPHDFFRLLLITLTGCAFRMVGIDKLPGVTVTVHVDGNPLEEYQDETGDDETKSKAVLRYIEAENDKEFIVVINAQPELQAELSSDSGYSGEEIRAEAKRLAAVGEIVIVVLRCSNLCQTGRSVSEKELKTEITGKVHEKALKGKAASHGTRLGTARRIKPGIHYSSTWIDSLEDPFATIRFRYRSKEALKKLRIIKRTPSPDPDSRLESPEIFESISMEQRQNIEEYIAKKLKVHTSIMIESISHGLPNTGQGQAGDTGCIDFQSPRKRSKKTSGKITIDLTSDS
ncbi:hypothetical protein BP5796_03475 [Coleophoma crateriformis]|uniref:DUF7918 domain-containing protein n=1 Tax=Coleophoma crateriformis TaxID=565419 RepID=A0A3D8SNM1_9HELO|nr:hypothetical protein BP5796_03475 [Coleophoma crateriformis]